MNAGVSDGRIPVNVSLSVRASVTVGFANDVDDVNHTAPIMYPLTANGTTTGFCSRDVPHITDKSPNAAINSPSHCAGPLLTFVAVITAGSENIRFARIVPNAAPNNWTAT